MRNDIIITGPWVKSSLSFSNGNCVECAAYRKASASQSGNCVEAGSFRTSSASASNGHCLEDGSCSPGIAVRDTKDRAGPVLAFSGVAWGRFLAGVKRS